jgi:hypothetical protein
MYARSNAMDIIERMGEESFVMNENENGDMHR